MCPDQAVSLARAKSRTVLGHTLRYQELRVTAPDGVALAVQDWGTSESPAASILFVHGFSQAHDAFLKQVTSSLAEHFRLVTFDLRGHGESDKPKDAAYYREPHRWAGDVQSIIEQAHLERPFLLAWSYGGRVALDYLTAHGDAGISGLIMVNATATASPDVLGPAIGALKQMTSPDEDVALSGVRTLLNECAATPLPAAELEYMLEYNQKVPALVRSHLAGRPADYQATLQSLKVPVLVIHGLRDRINQAAMATYVGTQVPHARVRFYEDAAHMPFWESAERFNQDVELFVRAAATRDVDGGPTSKETG